MTTNLTTAQAADLRNVNSSTIRRWCETGKIRAVKVGRDWMIDGDSLIVKHQHPARKGPVNRVSLSCCVEPGTLEVIWQESRELNKSLGEVIDLWAKGK